MENILDKYKNRAFIIFFLLNFSLGLIGPYFSFYSLIEDLNYSQSKAYIYSISTFLADFISILVVSYIYKKLSNIDNFKYWLLLYTLSYTPIWLADIFDISQYLRFLSSIGLLFSVIVLSFLLKKNLEKKKVILFNIIHIIFYILDAAISESIAVNPIISKLFIQIFH